MTAPLWTSAAAAAATGGQSGSDGQAGGVSIDTRSVAPGDLFVALRGPSFDGHDFVAEGLKQGAAAALVSRRPDDVAADAPLLVVDDTMAALNALGQASRARGRARIVAVTGSVGKTGIKEALRHLLGRQGETAASASSLNNHWGVPLSLARMPAHAAYGVFEVGMNHPGEITPLTRLIRPHVAVITTVEAVHSEFFESVAEIADAKAEIFDGMDAGGTAVLNRDNPHFERLRDAALARGIANIVGFGTGAACEIRLLDGELEPHASRVTADIAGTVVAYRIGVPGRHWTINSLAVLAAVRALGADVEAAAAAFADLPALDGRGRSHTIRLEDGPVTVIDESYNANPASMRALIDTLSHMAPAGDGRTIAVLGEMRELGSQSPAQHESLAEPLAAQGIDLVFTAGADMKHLFDALPPALRGAHADTGAVLAELVCDALRPGDVIAVKGSNASGMNVVVERLLHCGPAVAAPADG